MTGDYTEVSLRPGDRWTGARLAQGGALVDNEWNLNLAAACRRAQHGVADILGSAAMVPQGSGAFKVTIEDAAAGGQDLGIGAGRIWVDGLEVVALGPFHYRGQPGVPPLPSQPAALVFLEVSEEEIPPVEDPSIGDPALGRVDSCARTRTGYRVRAVGASVDDLTMDWRAWASPGSTALLTIRPSTETPTDPCAPRGPALLAPNGLFRVEVMASGPSGQAVLAWSFDNGACAAAIGAVASGGRVTPVPTPTARFSSGDLVEVSLSGRRARAEDHGSLYRVLDLTSAGGRDTLTLGRESMDVLEGLAKASDFTGVVVRRWDGAALATGDPVVATLRGIDVGVTYEATNPEGVYLAGDWWGSRLRSGGAPPVEERINQPPDGIGRHVAPLAFVRLDEGGVADLRQSFPMLTDPSLGATVEASPATVTARPADNLQDALARMPPTGGELKLAAGVYHLAKPLHAVGRTRLVVSGSGSSTILRADSPEGALLLDDCHDVTVRDLRVEGKTFPSVGRIDPPVGLVNVAGCSDLTLVGCEWVSPDAVTGVQEQPCLVARPSDNGAAASAKVVVEDCRLWLGLGQSGIVLRDMGDRAAVLRCSIVSPGRNSAQGIAVTGDRCSIKVLHNIVDGVRSGILAGGLGRSTNDVVVAENIVHLSVPPGAPGMPAERHAVEVMGAHSARMVDNAATLTPSSPPDGIAAADSGIQVSGEMGPFLMVRRSSMPDFPVGVSVQPRFLTTRVLLFARDANDGRFYVNMDTGFGWEGWRPLPGSGIPTKGGGIQPAASLSAQSLGGTVYLFATGSSDRRIYYNTSPDGVVWAGWKEVPGDGTTDAAVAAEVFNGELFLFGKGMNVDLSYVTIGTGAGTGFRWTDTKQLPKDQNSLTTPIAVNFQGYLNLYLYRALTPWGDLLFVDGGRFTWDGQNWSGREYFYDIVSPQGFYLPSVAVATSSQIYFFGVFAGWTRWRAGIYGQWNPIAGPDAVRQVSALYTDRIYLFAVGYEGSVKVNTAIPEGSGLPWTGWRSPPGSFVTDMPVAAVSVEIPSLWTVSETLGLELGLGFSGVLANMWAEHNHPV